MLLLNDIKDKYDVYEGTLPIGGSLKLQKKLLKKLRSALTTKDNKIISVSIEDNFFNLSSKN